MLQESAVHGTNRISCSHNVDVVITTNLNGFVDNLFVCVALQKWKLCVELQKEKPYSHVHKIIRLVQAING